MKNILGTYLQSRKKLLLSHKKAVCFELMINTLEFKGGGGVGWAVKKLFYVTEQLWTTEKNKKLVHRKGVGIGICTEM